VSQDPLAGFVTDTVEEELAYSLEQMGVDPMRMRTRVEETLDILGLAEVRSRALVSLSSGQQQRVAIGSVLAAGVRVLVLDEPTSALDPGSSEEVLATLLRLVHDLGLTVVMAEHRLERVISYADQMILLGPQGQVTQGTTREMIQESLLQPPVVVLGRIAGFDSVPLSVRQARSMAGPLRESLATKNEADYPRVPPAQGKSSVPLSLHATTTLVDTPGLTATKLNVTYGGTIAVDNVSLEMPPGQVSVIMGRNGSGKSSLLWALTGVTPLSSGRFSVGGKRLDNQPPAVIRDYCRLVPSNASDLLFCSTVAEECEAADSYSGQPGLCRQVLDALAPHIDPISHPRDLSEGQKLSLVLAIQLTAYPQVILLDEPTRGLDYQAKATLAQILEEMANQGRVVGVVTHDVEFAAEVAHQICVMASGEIIQTGTAAGVLGSSALFAPQVAKIVYPQPWLTPYQVAQALGDS
jgi:energy-coupling factor transport system ATP-binding protein